MLIVVHGFNGTGKGGKAAQLDAALPDIRVESPTLPHVPDKAVAVLDKLVKKGSRRGKPVALAGASLGGLYAAYLAAKYDLPAILFNPLVDDALLRDYIGPQKNFNTGKSYEWTAALCDQLTPYLTEAGALAVPPLVLLDQGDEVYGHWQAMRHYEGHADIRVYPGGSHAFDHLGEAMPVIRKYLEGRC
jgi:predicted esterase YcpF (UPF0227 family)